MKPIHQTNIANLFKNASTTVVWLGSLLSVAMLPTVGTAQDQVEKATVKVLAEELLKPGMGPEGFPLPVAAHWNTGFWMSAGSPAKELVYTPDYMIGLIRKGHHAIPTIANPSWLGHRAKINSPGFDWIGAADKGFEQYWKPALEFLRDNNLPVIIPSGNLPAVMAYDPQVKEFHDLPREKHGAMFNAEGRPYKALNPLADIGTWRAAGRYLVDNDLWRRIQEVYPDPPLVLIVDNNELKPSDDPKILSDPMYGGRYDGMSDVERVRLLRKSITERHIALHEEIRNNLSPGWKKSLKIAGYNNWGSAYVPPEIKETTFFDPAVGHVDWMMFDGTMPEFYDNQWQPLKTDHTPWSPQAEALGIFSMRNWVNEQRPAYWFSSIIWDGYEAVGDRPSKPWQYMVSGQRWDENRYEGMLQFGLWAMRPQVMFEFRGQTPGRDAMFEPIWMRLVESVDLVHQNPTLARFWTHGKLVANVAETNMAAKETANVAAPIWMKRDNIKYLLDAKVNPGMTKRREATTVSGARGPGTKPLMRVWSLALELGKSPNREFLVYAHAPLGAETNVAVVLGDVGEIVLPQVSLTGSFFVVQESGKQMTTLIRGGPPQMRVATGKTYVGVNENVEFEAALTLPPDEPILNYTWIFPDGTKQVQNQLAPIKKAFTTPGQQLVAVEASLKSGGKMTEQVLVWVGTRPDRSVIYHLPLTDSFSWRGPFVANPKSRELVTYRHLPNKATSIKNLTGADVMPIVVGGVFVNDSEKGRVLELKGDGIESIHFSKDLLDTAGEQTSKTIALSFKAEDVQARQVLYNMGFLAGAGLSIYLDGGKVYVGQWQGEKKSWLSADVNAGKWYHVALVIDEGTKELLPDKLQLYLNNRKVASGPGMARTASHGESIIGKGRAHVFHDHNKDDPNNKQYAFSGRLSNFVHANANLFSSSKKVADFRKEAERALVKAVNFGGDATNGDSGVAYKADPRNNGRVLSIGPLIPFTATNDSEVYRSVRIANPIIIEESIPNGKYEVVLQFAELNADGADKRIMDIQIEGKPVITGLDIAKRAGDYAALALTFPVAVADGALNIQLIGSKDSATIAGMQIWKVP